jgi:NitT/TauT family transport system permease protein
MDLFKIRKELPRWQAGVFGLLCVVLTIGVWALVTRGETSEERMVSALVLPSPQETVSRLDELWFERALVRNTFASLRRVVVGFALAVAVGVPIGILCGCFAGLSAFFSPLTTFGRNIPVAALIPLTFSLFGIGEVQKVMFIFIACVAFVISDSARAVSDVGSSYIDTAYTLGAGRRTVILKVLVPLAMPGIFNSLRLLFGIAFGYIMLAEVVKLGAESGGLGDIIIMSQRRGEKEHILLVLLIIPVVAFALDRGLLWVQKQLFPYRYGGSGVLHRGVRAALHRWEDLKGLVRARPSARWRA